MMPRPTDSSRDRLLGLLALQNGLINQARLVAAFQAWTLDKHRSLADPLVARGDLDADASPASSHPGPTRRHEGRWILRPFSRDAALDSRPSCSGGFLQGPDERGHGPVSFDPAELGFGPQEARHAPPPPHLPVTPPRHPRRDPARHRERRLDGIGRGQRPTQRPCQAQPDHRQRLLQPSRRLEAASALIRSSQRVVASRDALAAS
jgi:hypothetical protein